MPVSISAIPKLVVKLEKGKKMGFTIAYCDNDETTARENFIGSMVMTQATANDMYKNADHFGLMILSDSQNVTNVLTNQSANEIKIYPVPARKLVKHRNFPAVRKAVRFQFYQ